MKNIIQLIVFSLASLIYLVLMIVLAFLPKLCSCLKPFSDKNYQATKLRNTRVRRIKRARLRVMYKSQITHETPTQTELEQSKGVFYDEITQQKIKDAASLALLNEKSGLNSYSGLYSLKTIIVNQLQFVLQNAKANITSLLRQVQSFSKRIIKSLPVMNNNKFSHNYFTQLRSYVSTSVEKYFNH